MTDKLGEPSSSGILSAIKETPFPPPKLQRRRHREAQIERAYELQRVGAPSPRAEQPICSHAVPTQNAAIKGATLYTFLGASSTLLSHHLFPRFRSQTLALKAFIVSGFTIFGFVVGADTVLLNHEGQERTEEDLVRTVARRELARKGIMASETEIERWKAQTRSRLLRERSESGSTHDAGVPHTTDDGESSVGRGQQSP